MDAHHEVERQGCRINRTRPEREAQGTPQGCGTAAVSFWLLYSLSKQRKSHSPEAKYDALLNTIDCHKLRLRNGLLRFPLRYSSPLTAISKSCHLLMMSPSQRRGLGEIATGFAFAKTWAWGDCHKLRLRKDVGLGGVLQATPWQ